MTAPPVLRELERVEHRVLAALRCVDAATGAGIPGPLLVTGDGLRIQRNRSGLFIIAAATAPAALAAHEAAFEAAPATPALGAVEVLLALNDPAGRYLPRTASLALPLDPDPARAASADSLFRPRDVALYASGTAPVGANWAVLRVSLRESGGDALGGALLLVSSDGRVIGRGLTDWRGEAMVPVPGVPVTTWSTAPGAVVVSEIAAQLDAVFDPAAGLRTPQAAVREGRAPAALPMVDPDRLEARRGTLPHAGTAVQLAAGRSQALSVALALP